MATVIGRNQVVAAFQDVIGTGEQADSPVEIFHFKISSKKLWGKSPMTLSLMCEARARGLQMTVDQYVYPASNTELETQFPVWVLDGRRDSVVDVWKS